MALNLGTPRVIGQRGGMNLIVRQDSLLFRDFNMEMTHEAGAPIGDYEEGSMFFNLVDVKTYFAANYKITSTPDLAWYKCNAIVDDEIQNFTSGPKLKATAVGSPAVVAGKYGNAITLDGIDDKLELPATLGLNLSSDWCISFWVYINAPFANLEEIHILERYLDVGHRVTIYIQGDAGTHGEIHVNWNSDANNGDVTTALPMTLDTWHHVQITHNNAANQIDFRINGSLDTAAATIGSVAFTTEKFVIGESQFWGNFGDTSYLIDDIKIWDTNRNIFSGKRNSIDMLNLDKIHWGSFNGTVVD